MQVVSPASCLCASQHSATSRVVDVLFHPPFVRISYSTSQAICVSACLLALCSNPSMSYLYNPIRGWFRKGSRLFFFLLCSSLPGHDDHAAHAEVVPGVDLSIVGGSCAPPMVTPLAPEFVFAFDLHDRLYLLSYLCACLISFQVSSGSCLFLFAVISFTSTPLYETAPRKVPNKMN